MIKVSTFCSGIGAAEQAFKNLDVAHEVVFACEIDKYARMSYEANHSAETMYEDMTQHDYVDAKYYSDINISGIPCQAFSLAGLRKGENDSRGLLFYDFYRYVKNQQPKIFIIENVKGLLSADKGVIFQNWIELLGRSVNGHEKMFLHEDSLEYNLHHTVLNSKNFGVPQNRERVFIVGIRKDLPNDFSFPIGWKLDKRLRDVLETEVDEKYYLSDKMQSYLINRKDNFNGGKINYKSENDVASCINASSKSIDISDNIIVEKVGFINQDTQASQVYGTNGISPTLSAGTHGYAQGYIKVPEATKKWYDIAGPGDSINISNTNSLTRQGRVGKGIANTLETSCNQVVVEPQLNQVAQIGGFESEEDWVVGGLQKNQTPRTDGICPALTSAMGMGGGQTPIVKVAELNLVHTLNGGKWDKINESCRRVYDVDGIAPTVTSMGGGNQEPKTVINSRIRRLTPLEVFRLQAFSDEFFHKAKSVNSDTQLYRQAGNSITVTVIESIIKNLLHLLQ